MKCERCDEEEAQREHICPYHQDIHDEQVICTCCEECEHQCAMDI